MLKHFTSLRFVAWFLILASPAVVRAQALADRVPADTTIYVGWSGASTTAPGFQGSHLQAVLAESNLPKVIDDLIPKVLDRIASEDKQAAEVIEIVRAVMGPMWRHPTAIALVGVDMNGANGPMPKLVMLCQAGDEAAVLKAKVDDLLKQAGKPPFPVEVSVKDGLVALVIGYQKIEDAVPSGAEGKSLANDPAFKKALAQVGKEAITTVYVDVEKVLALVEVGTGFASPEIQLNWRKARDMLGLTGIKRAIVTQGFDGKDWGARAFIEAPAPRSGFLGSLIEGKPLSKELLKSIPENSTLAGAFHFDLAALVEAVRSAIISIEPRAKKDIDQALEQARQMVGFDIEKDLLGSLGDEWAYYCDPAVAGNGIVGAMLLNRLKDPEKFESSVVKLQDFIKQMADSELKKNKATLSFRHEKVGGVMVHFVGTPLVTPAWAVGNGNLYVGLYPEIVAAAAAHVPGTDKSIADSPAFGALFQRLGDHPVSAFGYVDLPRLAPETYSIWLAISHIANAADIFGVPAPVMILPPLKKLLPELSPAGQIAWTDPDGLHIHALMPFPGAQVFGSNPGAFAIGEVGLMASLMMPSLSKAREQAQRAKSSSNLRQIGFGAVTYANTHNGKYPKDLGELCVGSGLSPSTFINPAGNENTIAPALTAEQIPEWVREHSDYVWNGEGKDTTLGADQPLAWENPDRAHANGINILFGDYHVEWQPMYQARETLARVKK